MDKLLSRSADLLNSQKVSQFFIENNFFRLGRNGQISLEIFPKKTLSQNELILYRVAFSKDGKKTERDVWGKTISKGQFRLIDNLSSSSAKNFVPIYFSYLDSLKFSFCEGLKGGSLRSFENNFTFLKRGVLKIASMLTAFQSATIPVNLLTDYSQKEENKFLEGSLAAIKNYSKVLGQGFSDIAKDYSREIFSSCWNEEEFCFTHFDFQASNIFYSVKKKRFYLLDYDLARKFNPALDVANFWVHLYVMSRYHFSREKTLSLCNGFLENYLRRSKFKKEAKMCFETFSKRTTIDIAKITASVFERPCPESDEVFKKLEEITKLWH